MWNWVYIYIFLFSLFLSLILTKLWRKIALRRSKLDRPSERKIHHMPKPLLGGVAIYLAFTVTVLVNMIVVHILVSNPAFSHLLPDTIIGHLRGAPVVWGKLKIILTGATLMMLLGLLDDLYGVRFRVKLAGQVLLALLLVPHNSN